MAAYFFRAVPRPRRFRRTIWSASPLSHSALPTARDMPCDAKGVAHIYKNRSVYVLLNDDTTWVKNGICAYIFIIYTGTVDALALKALPRATYSMFHSEDIEVAVNTKSLVSNTGKLRKLQRTS